MKNSFSPIFGNGMVIQCNKAFPIWNKEKFSVEFLGKTYKSIKNSDKWLITLDPVNAGGPFSMKITFDDDNDDNFIEINDIYSGDVWLCSGQSNMEMQMHRLRDDYKEEWEAKDFPIIRQFNVPQKWDFNEPDEDISGGRWLTPSVETLHEFSGTAWFFAKKLYEKNKIPIGLINTAWGGTPVEAWMSKNALAGFPSMIATGEQYADTVRCEEIAKNTGEAIQKWESDCRNADTGLKENWQKTETDISNWKEMLLPGDFAKAGLDNFCGVIWLAKEFEITADFAAKDARVWLGTIVDSDTVYINGTEIGYTGYRYPPRKYVPENVLKEGKNRIVIRVTCNNGEGEITQGKPFRIFTENEIVELSGAWKFKIGAEAPIRPADFFFQRQPFANHYTMIAPVLKFPLKGVIWYQGESNDSNPHVYEKLFPLMIQEWREINKNNDLPFLFVQLPIWKAASDNDESSSWAIIREAQANALSLPATGMAAGLELGEWNDLHPLNKKDIGYRLYLAAEKTVYKNNNTSPGPMLRNLELSKDKINLYFNNCGGGLTSDETPFFSIICNDGQIRLAGKIEAHDKISIDISGIKGVKKILYAFADNPIDRQLFNSDGLPMIPFRKELTDGENPNV